MPTGLHVCFMAVRADERGKGQGREGGGGGVPTKRRPALAQARAKSAFSDRKP